MNFLLLDLLKLPLSLKDVVFLIELQMLLLLGLVELDSFPHDLLLHLLLRLPLPGILLLNLSVPLTFLVTSQVIFK